MPHEIILEEVEDGPICHYLSFSKLLRLITDSAIFFPKLQCYQRLDPYECTLWPAKRYADKSLAHLRWWATTVTPFNTMSPNSSTDERIATIRRVRNEIERADSAQVAELIKTYEIREWAEGVICNCWHLNAEESDAMWKIYSGNSGAAIFTTVKQLASSILGYLTPNEYEKNTPWVIVPVLYRNEDQLTDLPNFYVEHPWVLKRRAFEHEKELRIFKALPGGDRAGSGHDVRVNTQALINKILLSPLNAEWENKVIETTLRELWSKRLSTVPLIQASRHLNPIRAGGNILAKVEQIKEREEDMNMMKAFQRIPAKLMLRGRMTHATDEGWIFHNIGKLLEIWDRLPDAVSQVVMIEEFGDILKFSRNEKVTKEARDRLESIRLSIFQNDPKGEKVSSEALAEIAKFLGDKLKG
jgi:hypothetical protein